MSTYGSLVNEILVNLQGYTHSSDHVTTLTAPLTATATSVAVSDTSDFEQGLVEIDDELIWVSGVDAATGTLSVSPFGRGFRGTTAADHVAGSAVAMSPIWPRSVVKREVNNVIRSLYPRVWGVGSTTVTTEPSQFAYAVDADAERILDLRWRVTGHTKQWERVRRWNFLRDADTEDFATGKAVEILDGVPSSTRLRVVFGKEPSVLTTDADVFTEVTGLPASCWDVIVLGVCYKLAPNLDLARLPADDVESDELDQPKPIGTASQVANTFYRLFQTRLAEEQQRMSDKYPALYRTVR